jgi:hypothetical protein
MAVRQNAAQAGHRSRRERLKRTADDVAGVLCSSRRVLPSSRAGASSRRRLGLFAASGTSRGGGPPAMVDEDASGNAEQPAVEGAAIGRPVDEAADGARDLVQRLLREIGRVGGFPVARR